MHAVGKHLGTAVAIKEMALQSSRQHEPAKFQAELDAAQTEIKILWELRHPHIMSFYGGCFDAKRSAFRFLHDTTHTRLLIQPFRTFCHFTVAEKGSV
jgi:hypothetical protein